MNKFIKYVFVLSCIILVIEGCKKEEIVESPKQTLSITDFTTISNSLSIPNGTLVIGNIDTTNVDSVKLFSTQNLEPTFPAGEVVINVTYSFKETLDKFRLEIIGAQNYWTAPVSSTIIEDTLKTGSFKFRTPETLKPGILKFRYQLYLNDSVKSPSQDGEVEILQFITSGGQINI